MRIQSSCLLLSLFLGCGDSVADGHARDVDGGESAERQEAGGDGDGAGDGDGDGPTQHADGGSPPSRTDLVEETNPACMGHISITNADSLAAVSSCRRVGALDFTNTALSSVALPLLEVIDDWLVFKKNDALTEISFPALTLVGVDDSDDGSLFINDHVKLERVEFPKLGAISRDLDLETKQPALAALTFPKLTEVGRITVRFSNLETLDFPLLSSVGGISVEANPVLARFNAPALTTAKDFFQVATNPLLPSCKVEAIEAQLTKPSEIVKTDGNLASCP